MTQKAYIGDHLTGVVAGVDKYATGIIAVVRPPLLIALNGGMMIQRSSTSLLSGTNYVANDTIEVGVLPANHMLVDWYAVIDSSDANASPTLAFNVGLWPGVVGDTAKLYSTIGTEGGAAVAFGKTAVSCFVRNSALPWCRVAPDATADRAIGMACTTATATAVAATRVLDFFLITREARYGK